MQFLTHYALNLRFENVELHKEFLVQMIFYNVITINSIYRY